MLDFKTPANTRFAAELSSQFRFHNEVGEEHSRSTDFLAVLTERYGKPGRLIPVRVGYNRFSLNLSMDGNPLPNDRGIADAPLMGADLELDTDGGLGTAKTE